MKHALLSASGASKWFTCTPSARLEETIQDNETSYAKEGTLAHELAEITMSYKYGKISKSAYIRRLEQIKKDELFSDEMLEHINNFADHTYGIYIEAKNKTNDVIVCLEERLDFSNYVPDGFGTGDVVMVCDGKLDIVDLKYGKGVLVSAEENKQMMLYALGALNAYELIYDIHEVYMTIYQPRLDNISTYSISVENLKIWAEQELKPRALLAWDGAGEFIPGDHCGFCKAKASCRARAEANLKLLKYEFKTADTLSHLEISDILKTSERLVNWVKDVKSYALQEALKGKKFQGFKLVEGKSNRIYIDEENVYKKLVSIGYTDDEIFETKLIGISAMERLLGKKIFSDVLNGLVIKPEGAPTLVPVTDKRLEINSAKEDFKDFVSEVS